MSIYLSHYPQEIQKQVATMIAENRLAPYLKQRYPNVHPYKTDSQLFTYAQELKRVYLRQTPPLQKVIYDQKLTITHQALGINRHRILPQGRNLTTKKEIRIASVFQHCPEPFLRMIVGHELAHLREMAHNKQFYQLCAHIVPEYAQREFEVRCFLTLYERGESVWE